MSQKKLISLGIPCFNEEKNVIPAYQALKKVTDKIKKYHFEFIFVDNGSSDATREKIKKIASKDKQVVGIFLSRNFGPESSNTACLNYATGDAFIGIPCDLQDPPELVPKFIKKWEKGYDIIVGIYRKNEGDYLIRFFRKTFYQIFKLISNINVPVNATGFGLIDKKVLKALNSLPEKYRFFRGLRTWVGFKSTQIEYDRQQRKKGKSSYNIFDYFKHAEIGLFGFSYLILDLMVYLGFLLVLFAFIFIFGYLFTVLVFGNPIKGAVTILVSIIFFGGVQLLAISIIGKYIQVIVEETKARPIYIVDKTINLKTSTS